MGESALSPKDLDYIRDLVRTRSAIVLEPEKAYLVQSRLEPLAKSEGLASLSELVGKLRSALYGALHKQVVEAMTTNETSFFRDLTPFQALREQLLPEIFARKGITKRLNMWCGASSSGQEPYSVMFTILEHFPELKDWVIQYTATDISEEMLAKCREGKYSQLEVNRAAGGENSGCQVGHLRVAELGGQRLRGAFRQTLAAGGKLRAIGPRQLAAAYFELADRRSFALSFILQHITAVGVSDPDAHSTRGRARGHENDRDTRQCFAVQRNRSADRHQHEHGTNCDAHAADCADDIGSHSSGQLLEAFRRFRPE